MTNTWLAHTDEQVWNTKGGLWPLDRFWPQRFLVYPGDPTSGPTKGGSPVPGTENQEEQEAYFSVEGLEGAWIPFGGTLNCDPSHMDLNFEFLLLTIFSPF